MSGYQVLLADGPDSAFDDLKGLPYTVRQQLAGIIRTELRLKPLLPPDEGILASGWLWRRGLTRQQQARLRRYPDSTEPAGPQAYNYVIIHRGFSRIELAQHGPGFYVYRVLTNEELASMAVALLAPQRQLASPRRRRLAG